MQECPCGSNVDYKECCGKYHDGAKLPTAEATMRARYSAFATHNVDFIINSHHPDKRDEVKAEEVEAWAKGSVWHGLNIVSKQAGEAKDKDGIVEFNAFYEVQGKIHKHHEIAEFKKKDDQWYFYDGQLIQDTIKREGPKVGRNDPCPCGSGKKYKKCCLTVSA
ncbi:MAG: hypothetical protein COW00_01615 [Bdellovibrio sp. CG12_big_fil_rev_8_21_14_0_65_39_13]|nr:MAG: hypothetical protein COW78_03365 [Bdellovibrio sp. CG22_combo_CG10-13_8_21_14_all_39_27]PIQ62408.1 MAG: hypothetical protein COW00_01615 [Bdellovibrio sp. CG12_big_fil_rev_8_21_14_0_65_39_13]PIR34074.1 MAG: hypothetical protein COV37_14095 [Bdellovibrio sp. CG11_big_fil_rev_8_21_14_0_20_39_38]PJB52968.1 MAG: hypothetical protein CO099_09690 [Bdellovibrio sp. CG_4_9_14_3_um_filter_39_7]